MRWTSICGLALLMVSLMGCGGPNYLDPYEKPYTWHPSGAPTANLAAQLANPRDLVSGDGGTGGDANASSLAIERVWQDRPKQITGAAGGGGSGGGSGGSGGASGSGGSN
jgi:type IV pilus biogenesis protein CpaD/CtpE